MAFLDYSGDIFLDAVLTDLGRKRLASGKFNIAKFALGDEEINYELWNSSDASGSAIYDIEILQTSSSTITRVIEGIITIRPQVTL